MNIKNILLCSCVAMLSSLGSAMPAFAENETVAVPATPAAAEPDQRLGENVAGSYLSGQFAKSRGNIGGAIHYLEQVHDDQPDDMDIAIQLQGMLLLEGRFDDAVTLADDIRNSDTKDPLADLLLVLHEMKAGNTDEAADLLTEAVDEDGTVQLWQPILLGWVNLSRHRLDKPMSIETLGTEVGRAGPLVNYHLALINSQAGFKDAAAKNFKNAIEDPQDPPGRIMKMLIKFYDQNDAPEILTPLVKAYQQAHPDGDDDVPAPVITTVNDGVAEMLYTMGGIMYGAGVVNDAAIYLQLAGYMKPDLEEATVALGDAYAEMQQYNQSNATYNRISLRSPLYTRAQLHIAVNYERMGKLKESLGLLDKMIKQSPTETDALVTKGDLLRIHARYGEAVEAYTQAIKRIPELHSNHWPILFARGSCLERLGKWSLAQQDLEQALALKPDQPDVLNYLGFAELERGQNIDEARDMIAKAVKARPNDAQIVDSMGWVLYMQGQYQNAAEYLEKAVELLPGDPTVNDHLGDAYWRLGRKTEARFQWERSLSFSPEPKLSESIRKKLHDGLPPAPATLANSQPSDIEGKPVMAATP